MAAFLSMQVARQSICPALPLNASQHASQLAHDCRVCPAEDYFWTITNHVQMKPYSTLPEGGNWHDILLDGNEFPSTWLPGCMHATPDDTHLHARRANIASIVGSEDACEGLAAALAGVEGVAVAEELLPYVVCAVVLQPYASAKLVRLCDRLSLQVWDRTRCDRTKAMWGAWSPSAGKRVLRSCEQIDSSVCLCSAVVGFCRAHNLF